MSPHYTFTSCLVIGLAGSAGAFLRFAVGDWTIGWNDTLFPWGTLLCNWFGCLLLGVMTSTITQRLIKNAALSLSVRVGLLGSFTTFSSISAETLHLFELQQWEIVFFYLAATFFGGLLLAWAGILIADRIFAFIQNNRLKDVS